MVLREEYLLVSYYAKTRCETQIEPIELTIY